MNSFLSTTLNPAYVQMYLGSITEPSNTDLEPVKLIIDADPQIANEKPFANISSLSYFEEEDEVLFMLGSIFRLIKIHRENNGIWSIQLALCGENDHDLNSLVQRMKNEYMKEPDLLELGLVVGRMGKPYEEEKYYIRLLEQLSRDDPLLGYVYYSLGVALLDQGDYNRSLTYLQESLKITREVQPSDYVRIGTTLNSIGEVYRMRGDYSRAVESYIGAMSLFQQAHDENHPKLAFIYNNIGIIYDEQNKHDEALTLYKKALNIQLKTLDPNHPDISGSYNNIGVVYQGTKQFDKALEYYHRALHIQQRVLPPQHPDIAMTLKNIGLVYANRGQFEEARLHWGKAADIYDCTFPQQHPDVQELHDLLHHLPLKV
jgi:tetratricopeptide (TPR) repeat protein